MTYICKNCGEEFPYQPVYCNECGTECSPETFRIEVKNDKLEDSKLETITLTRQQLDDIVYQSVLACLDYHLEIKMIPSTNTLGVCKEIMLKKNEEFFKHPPMIIK